MAFVDNDIYDSILLEFSKEKKQVERIQKERARKAITDSPDAFNVAKEEVEPKEEIQEKDTLLTESKSFKKDSANIVKEANVTNDIDKKSNDGIEKIIVNPLRKLKKVKH